MSQTTMTLWQRIKWFFGRRPAALLPLRKRKQLPMDTGHYMQPYAIPAKPTTPPQPLVCQSYTSMKTYDRSFRVPPAPTAAPQAMSVSIDEDGLDALAMARALSQFTQGSSRELTAAPGPKLVSGDGGEYAGGGATGDWPAQDDLPPQVTGLYSAAAPEPAYEDCRRESYVSSPAPEPEPDRFEASSSPSDSSSSSDSSSGDDS